MKIDHDRDPIPAHTLKNAILSLSSLIGKPATDDMINELVKHGIDLFDSEEYFLHEVREGLDMIFGIDASELIIERIKKSLEQS